MPAELSFGSLKTTIIAEQNHILGYSHSFCLDCDIKVVSKSTIVKAPSPHLTIQVTQNPLDCKTKISSKQMFHPDLVKFDKINGTFFTAFRKITRSPEYSGINNIFMRMKRRQNVL